MHINALELRFGPRSRMFVGSKMKLVQQMFVQVVLYSLRALFHSIDNIINFIC